jgi:hypothetical protein
VAAQPKQDVRAVENPISAVIDLGEEVSARLPEFRRMTLYALVFIGFFLVLLFFLILAGIVILLTQDGPGLLIASLVFFIIGILAFQKLRRSRDFFRYYEARHRAIRAVREEEVVRVPPGPDPESRLIAYLATRDPGFARAVSEGRVQRNAAVQGKRGAPSFAISAVRASDIWHDLFKMGDAGCAVFARTSTRYPTLKEVMEFEAAVKDVCEKMSVAPTRAAWLVHSASEPLSEDVYDYVVKKVIEVDRGFITKDIHVCSLQVVTELSDGTYDFIPFVAAGA